MNKLSTLLILSAAFAGIYSAANAQLLLHEDFESYNPGTLTGQSSTVTGFTGTWSGLGEAEIVKGAAGNVLRVHPTGKWTGLSLDLSETSPFGQSLLGNELGARLYISFFYELEAAETVKAQALVGFLNAFDSKGLMVGQMWNQKTFGGAFGKNSERAIDTEAHNILIELTRQGGGAIQAKVYLDPINPSKLPLSAQEPDCVLWPKDKQLKVFAVKANANSFLMDELKIGLSAKDVLPK